MHPARPDDRPPPGLTADAASDWQALGRPTPAPAAFTAESAGSLPAPVRRWLRHALVEGTPLTRSTRLRMQGEIRLGRWAPFTAVQRLAVGVGFVWAATARPLRIPVTGFDRWTRGSGEMRWRVLGRVPLISGGGEDVTRSAAGRYAGELLLADPAAALDPEVTWHPLDDDRAVATVRSGTTTHDVTVRVGEGGALTEVSLQRWGPLGAGSYGLQPFGATLDGKLTAGGVTVPRRITAGWHFGTDRWAEGQFIRWTVDEVRHR